MKKEAAELSSFGVSFSDPEIDVKKIGKWKDSVVKKLTGGLMQKPNNKLKKPVFRLKNRFF